MATTFDNKTQILADLWLNYRQDEGFADFVEYNDIGLPLAYAVANGIVKTTDVATRFIDETFDLLLASLGFEDLTFEDLDELLGSVDE
jgi:hypothetical protein